MILSKARSNVNGPADNIYPIYECIQTILLYQALLSTIFAIRTRKGLHDLPYLCYNVNRWNAALHDFVLEVDYE